MPADKYFEKKVIIKELVKDGIKFKFELYLEPSELTDKKEEIIKKFGNQKVKGKHCLDITEEFVREGLDNEEYNGLIFVKNSELEDSASCSFQVYDWCETGKPQFWINDLCRITELSPKPSVSPVEVLMKILEKLASKRFNEVYLAVDKEEVKKGKLPELYKNKYKFTEDSTCYMDGDLAMKKKVSKRGSSRNYTKKNPKKRNS